MTPHLARRSLGLLIAFVFILSAVPPVMAAPDARLWHTNRTFSQIDPSQVIRRTTPVQPDRNCVTWRLYRILTAGVDPQTLHGLHNRRC